MTFFAFLATGRREVPNMVSIDDGLRLVKQPGGSFVHFFCKVRKAIKELRFRRCFTSTLATHSMVFSL